MIALAGKTARAVCAAVCAALLVLPAGLFMPGIKRALYGAAPTAANHPPARVSVTLKEGDYVLFGRYLGEPILWRVIAVEGGKPLLFSEYVLCFKAFAACARPPEASGDWRSSALRQWLNSPRAAVPWSGDPPTAANIYEGRNAYAREPGFLYGFSAGELALIEPGEDRVFLLTRGQLRQLPAARRKKAPTKAALRQDDSPYLFVRPTSWYWATDPVATSAASVCAVTGKGTFYKSLAADGMNGVCPALRLAGRAAWAAGGDGGRHRPYEIAGE